MPHIDIKMIEGRSEDQKRRLARAFTDIMTDILEVSPDAISIAIQEYPASNWAHGGQLLADKAKSPAGS